MTPPRILIACIGNIFFGDDGFGTEVARRLAGHRMPEGVTVKDFGIRSLDLAYSLLDPHELVILVDACQRGGAPGTIYVIEPERLPDDQPRTQLEGHTMNPASVLRMVHSMGGSPGRVLLVGCEPADLGTEEEGKLGLSEAVMLAVEPAIGVIKAQILKVTEGTAAVR